jgi:hypothetical protein
MSGEIPNPVQEPEEEEGITATINHAYDFGLPLRQEGENAKAFRARISGALREKGHMIEAHEAWTGKYFDQGDTSIGILGSVAMKMKGVDFGTDDGTLVGDEIAAGHLANAPKRRNDDTLLLFALFMDGNDQH